MKRSKSRKAEALQLELFESDMRSRTDKELIAELTNRVDEVADEWEGGYRLESLFNYLTPHRRQIACAAIELYKRREVRQRHRIQLTSSEAVYQLMHPLLADLSNEEFWLIGLDRAFKMISRKRMSVGGLDQTMADVRLMARQLIQWQAPACIVCHNHPSGNSRPSGIDKQLTKQLYQALKVLNITISDHIIVTVEWYYSFNDEGEL